MLFHNACAKHATSKCTVKQGMLKPTRFAWFPGHFYFAGSSMAKFHSSVYPPTCHYTPALLSPLLLRVPTIPLYDLVLEFALVFVLAFVLVYVLVFVRAVVSEFILV